MGGEIADWHSNNCQTSAIFPFTLLPGTARAVLAPCPPLLPREVVPVSARPTASVAVIWIECHATSWNEYQVKEAPPRNGIRTRLLEEQREKSLAQLDATD